MENEERGNQTPFRREALEYIAAPQPQGDFVQIISPLAWTLALMVWILIGTLVAWLFLGVVDTHIEGKGIMLTAQEGIVYVSALDTQGLHPGITVKVSPSTGKQWQYRRISGQMTAVDDIPTTEQDMLQILKNPSLVNYFLLNVPVIALHISISDSLAPGSLINVRMTVRRQTPLSLIFQR